MYESEAPASEPEPAPQVETKKSIQYPQAFLFQVRSASLQQSAAEETS